MKVMTLFALTLLPLLGGCGKPAGDAQDKTYEVKGKVVAVDMEKKKVTLDHEDIPGLMKAMQMPFAVASAALLADIKPGDQVHGKLKVTSGKYVLLELKKR